MTWLDLLLILAGWFVLAGVASVIYAGLRWWVIHS